MSEVMSQFFKIMQTKERMMNIHGSAATTQTEPEGFFRQPYSLFKATDANGKKFSRAALAVFGTIFSYSNVEGDPEARCFLSYAGFQRQLNISHATVARALAAGSKCGLIARVAEPKKAYRVTLDDAEGFILSEYYLNHTAFKIRGEEKPRFLTKAQIDVYSLIKTHCQNPKNGHKFKGSVRGIMSTLHLAKRTVQDAISILLRADLIHREARGINSYERSTFTVNNHLIRSLKHTYKKSLPRPASKRRPSDEDLRTERERFYAQLRQQAQARVDQFQRLLDADSRFRKLDLELRPIAHDKAVAEINGQTKRLEELGRKEKSLKVRLARRMTELGISAEDLKPRFRCSVCHDTGFRIKDGKPCGCFPPGGAP